ncbi:ABC transporter ATP-binding protein/permease [Natronoglycomyces albus]|uniref:ATP-binding cassette domain-containing protein n=1 Tax=Natronoglycomyces albus TaxID=2811108 RepID=A0A895XK29_9ACTN|nr:ATP-binding cassette domain-containing protein [Natronoglycomyces albus]QSB04172.1 ATP-binding cassette domain-containing protein [Natronoglycomyces albus]
MIHLRLLPLARSAYAVMGLAVLVGLSLSTVAIAQALVTADIFAGIISGTPIGDLTLSLVLLSAALLARPLLVFAREMTVHLVATRVKTAIRERMLTAMFAAGPIALGRERSGTQQSHLVDGVENLEPYFGRYIPQVLITAVTSLAVVGALVLIDPVVGFVVGAVAILVPFVPRLWDRLLAKRGDSHWGAYAKLNAEVVDSLRGMTTLKAFNAARRRRTQLQESSDSLLAATLHQLRISLLESGLTGLFLIAGPAIALIVGVTRVQSGAVDPLQLFAITLLAFEVFRPFRELSNHWHAGYSGVSAGRRIRDLLQAGASDAPTEPTTPLTSANGGHETKAAIEARSLTFTYPHAHTAALRDVDLTIDAGSTVALVGPSGSGKSTVASLLLRLAVPQHGQLLIGGVPTSSLTQKQCAEIVALVSQSPVLFSGSVRENLQLVAPEADEATLKRAIDIAGANDIVTDERGGLDAPVGDGGGLLSGGQKQRLAIARAVLKDAPILILDEASSALDARREESVFASLADSLTRTGGEPITTIIIAHRLASIRHVDTVFVLREGQVVERGTATELLQSDGLFAALHRAQNEQVSV